MNKLALKKKIQEFSNLSIKSSVIREDIENEIARYYGFVDFENMWDKHHAVEDNSDWLIDLSQGSKQYKITMKDVNIILDEFKRHIDKEV